MNANVSTLSPRVEIRGLGEAAGAMFLVGTLAGVSGVIQDYPIYGGQALRYLLAAGVLFAVARIAGLGFVRLTLRETLLLVALSLTGLVIFNVAVIEATRHGGPALVGTVLGTVPLALALLGGRPTPRVIGAATVVVAGATLATGLGSGDLPGLLWSLGALFCEVCFSLLAIPLLPKLGAVRISAYSAALAVPLLVVVGLLVDGTAMLRVPSPARGPGPRLPVRGRHHRGVLPLVRRPAPARPGDRGAVRGADPGGRHRHRRRSRPRHTLAPRPDRSRSGGRRNRHRPQRGGLPFTGDRRRAHPLPRHVHRRLRRARRLSGQALR